MQTENTPAFVPIVPQAPFLTGSMDLLLWFYARLRPYRLECLGISVAILLQVALYVLYPLGFQVIFDKVIPYRNVTLLSKIMWELAGLFLVCGAAAVFQGFLVARVGSAVLRDLRLAMFDQLNRLSSGFFMKVDSADLLSRFSFEIASIELALIRALPIILECSLVVIACLGTICIIDWRISLVALILLPLGLISAKWIGPRADVFASERSFHESRMLGVLQESLLLRPILRAFGLEEERRRIFAARNEEVAQSSTKLGFAGSLMGVASLYSTNILLITIVGAGAALVVEGNLSLGAFFGSFALLMSVAAAASTGASWFALFKAALTKAERIERLLAEKITVADLRNAQPLAPLQESIRFQNVTFGYSPIYPILRTIHLTIPAATSVAIVGASGSGKSTLLNLVARFSDPLDGVVTFDGHDLRTVLQASVRSQIGMVMQSDYLFNTSITENIRLGKLDATQDEVERAARMAEIHDDILKLPHGYNTVIGEQGGVLSGGQRQRISIARAIVRNPRLLLLDEPTSALDPGTESSINASIHHLAAGRTVVMVTHRLSSVQLFNKIIVLQEGQVVEEGTHAELLARDGTYANLWKKQSGFSINDLGFAKVEPERLLAVPIFAGLSREVLKALAGRFVTESFEPGFIPIREGDPGDRFYIVVRGRLEGLKQSQDGKRQKTFVLQDGDHFGEIALVEDIPRTATLRAQTKTYCLSLGREHFSELVSDQPIFRDAIQKSIAERSTA